MKEYNAKYRNENINKIKEYKKNYFQKNKYKIKQNQEINKEKIKAQRYEKHNCNCGGKYTNNSKATHEKTTKHKKYIQTQHVQQ